MIINYMSVNQANPSIATPNQQIKPLNPTNDQSTPTLGNLGAPLIVLPLLPPRRYTNQTTTKLEKRPNLHQMTLFRHHLKQKPRSTLSKQYTFQALQTLHAEEIASGGDEVEFGPSLSLRRKSSGRKGLTFTRWLFRHHLKQSPRSNLNKPSKLQAFLP